MERDERNKRLEAIGARLRELAAERASLMQEWGALEAERKAEEIEIQHPITREDTLEDHIRRMEAIVSGTPEKGSKKHRGPSADTLKQAQADMQRLLNRLKKKNG